MEIDIERLKKLKLDLDGFIQDMMKISDEWGVTIEEYKKKPILRGDDGKGGGFDLTSSAVGDENDRHQ